VPTRSTGSSRCNTTPTAAHLDATRPQQQPRSTAAHLLIFPQSPALRSLCTHARGQHGGMPNLCSVAAYPSAVHLSPSGGSLSAWDGCGTQLPLGYTAPRTQTNCTASAHRALHWKSCAAAMLGFAACARMLRAVRVRRSIAMEPVTISCGGFGTDRDEPYSDGRIVTSSDTVPELAATMWGHAAADHLSVDV